MACDRMALVAQRLASAEEDLAAAEKLASGEALLAPAIYHCTLAGEKALKTYMLYLDICIPVTHDLTLLVDALAEVEPKAAGLIDVAELLTPYGIAYRSAEPLVPGREEFERALERTYEVHDFVIARMPEIG